MKLEEDFSFWFDPAEEIDEQTRRALEQNRDEIIPTEPVPGVPGAYWCEMNRNFVRFLTDNDETKLFDALARLAARGEANVGEGSRYVGSFRACGLIVPVFELPEGARAADVAPGTQALAKALAEALTVTERLDDKERRARQGPRVPRRDDPLSLMFYLPFRRACRSHYGGGARSRAPPP